MAGAACQGLRQCATLRSDRAQKVAASGKINSGALQAKALCRSVMPWAQDLARPPDPRALIQ
eukprot:7274918-Pyramimonas_sp.AAC.1